MGGKKEREGDERGEGTRGRERQGEGGREGQREVI